MVKKLEDEILYLLEQPFIWTASKRTYKYFTGIHELTLQQKSREKKCTGIRKWW